MIFYTDFHFLIFWRRDLGDSKHPEDKWADNLAAINFEIKHTQRDFAFVKKATKNFFVLVTATQSKTL